MNSTSAKFLALISAVLIYGAIIFLLFAVLPLSSRAETNAAETGASNGLAVTDGISAATKPPVSGTMTTNKKSSSVESTPVRIDDTGGHASSQNQGENSPAALGGLAIGALTMLIPFAPFVMIVSIVAIVFYFNHRRNKLAHETLRAMIEKGMPVTPELIANLNDKGIKRGEIRNRGTGRLLVGLILVGVGIGTIVIAGKPGFIPLFIGVAFLIVWLVERGNTTTHPPSNQPPPGQ